MGAWHKPITLAIVGAEKAGTTTLFRLLSQSPVLAAHAQAELTAFVNTELWGKGEDWALEHYFPAAGDRQLLMKDVMLMGFPDALARLRESSPGVRVMAVLREACGARLVCLPLCPFTGYRALRDICRGARG